MGRALLVLENHADRQKATMWIGKAPAGTRIEFKASKRTLPQNDLLWALLTEVSQQLNHAGKKYEPSQWKAIFLHAFGREVSFLPSLDQKTFLPIELSSSDLSKDEMTDFIEFILKEAGERGVVFKDHRHKRDTQSGAALPPEADEPEVSPASGSSTYSDTEWLKIAARMLWAATHVGGDTDANLDLLNNQRLAVAELAPSTLGQVTRDRAGTIYRQCKAVVMSEVDQVKALKFIAGVAGMEPVDIGGAR
ncbi:recombination protein NinB [Agrobacterium vitis]|uniref:recombination protein NinB n=1 Tax=Agrobacterium vitis TaxID=373 RepID=UPI0015742E2B|nr:recombination protein NinB [Agrobacterium vitis]NSZ52942.1 hypothetical protein [Agrobacterium vitis]NTA31701.1 hypothetical protein [Agrobacterium vitis]